MEGEAHEDVVDRSNGLHRRPLEAWLDPGGGTREADAEAEPVAESVGSRASKIPRWVVARIVVAVGTVGGLTFSATPKEKVLWIWLQTKS